MLKVDFKDEKNITSRKRVTYLFWRVEVTILEPLRVAWRVRDLGSDERGLSCLLPAATITRVFTMFPAK